MAAKRLGHLGVQQDKPVGPAPVRELGDRAVGLQFEAGLGAVVGYPLVLVHATIVASRDCARQPWGSALSCPLEPAARATGPLFRPSGPCAFGSKIAAPTGGNPAAR